MQTANSKQCTKMYRVLLYITFSNCRSHTVCKNDKFNKQIQIYVLHVLNGTVDRVLK